MCKAIMRREKSTFSERVVVGRERATAFELWVSDCGNVCGFGEGENVRDECLDLYQMLLLQFMERVGLPLLGDIEELAGKMMEELRMNIMRKGDFRPVRTLMPVDSLIWIICIGRRSLRRR